MLFRWLESTMLRGVCPNFALVAKVERYKLALKGSQRIRLIIFDIKEPQNIIQSVQISITH